MPKAANRAQNVQIPGAETAQPEGNHQAEGQAGEQAQTEGVAPAAALPADVQALVQMEVARILARQQASRNQAKAEEKELPTQAEALAKVNADPKRRSVLSKDGWVVTNKPIAQGRDESGFAKA